MSQFLRGPKNDGELANGSPIEQKQGCISQRKTARAWLCCSGGFVADLLRTRLVAHKSSFLHPVLFFLKLGYVVSL